MNHIVAVQVVKAQQDLPEQALDLGNLEVDVAGQQALKIVVDEGKQKVKISAHFVAD